MKRFKYIRLSHERWDHICTQHPECAAQLELIERIIHDPDLIQEGTKGEYLYQVT